MKATEGDLLRRSRLEGEGMIVRDRRRCLEVGGDHGYLCWGEASFFFHAKESNIYNVLKY